MGEWMIYWTHLLECHFHLKDHVTYILVSSNPFLSIYHILLSCVFLVHSCVARWSVFLMFALLLGPTLCIVFTSTRLHFLLVCLFQINLRHCFQFLLWSYWWCFSVHFLHYWTVSTISWTSIYLFTALHSFLPSFLRSNSFCFLSLFSVSRVPFKAFHTVLPSHLISVPFTVFLSHHWHFLPSHIAQQYSAKHC